MVHKKWLVGEYWHPLITACPLINKLNNTPALAEVCLTGSCPASQNSKPRGLIARHAKPTSGFSCS
jgi:hypothetical protein